MKSSSMSMKPKFEASDIITPKGKKLIESTGSRTAKLMLNGLNSPTNKNYISLPDNSSVSTSNSGINLNINKKNKIPDIQSSPNIPKIPMSPPNYPYNKGSKKMVDNILTYVKIREKNKFPTIKVNNRVSDSLKTSQEKLSKNKIKMGIRVTSPKTTNLRRINKSETHLGVNKSGNVSGLMNNNGGSISQLTTQTNSINNSTNNSPKPEIGNTKPQQNEKNKIYSSTDLDNLQESVNVNSLLNNKNIPVAISNLSVYFPFYETAKCSTKTIGHIKAYAANTYQGVVRNYNEDRVSIILNISRPPGHNGFWPKCSFFGIYDGHGGSLCSDFLRDHLHNYVIKDENFPKDPIKALKKGFEKAESDFILEQALTKNYEILDKSGSCAICLLIKEDLCYVANVGDSRAVLSMNSGKEIKILTKDHKPNEEGEKRRIIENGGKVYQTQTPSKLINLPNITNTNQILLGPHRVFPGRLSVSRTFGDVEAKLTRFGGIPGVIVASPDIEVFKVNDECDFLVLGCDGIFDQLSSQEAADSVFMTLKEDIKAKNIHSQVALGVDMIMKTALVRRTLDNVTVLILAFNNFENIFNKTTENDKDSFHPKSSLYSSNVVEDNQQVMSDVNNYHSNPEFISTKSPERVVKQRPRISKIQLNEGSDSRKVKSISPQNTILKSFSPPDDLNSKNMGTLNLRKRTILSPKYQKLSKLEIGKRDELLKSSCENVNVNSEGYTYKGKHFTMKYSDNMQIANMMKKLQK